MFAANSNLDLEDHSVGSVSSVFGPPSVSVWEPLPCAHGTSGGAKYPPKNRYLPYLARFQVKTAIGRQNCAKLGKSQGSQPEFSPFSSRMRAGQTFPQWQWQPGCPTDQAVAMWCVSIVIVGFMVGFLGYPES